MSWQNPFMDLHFCLSPRSLSQSLLACSRSLFIFFILGFCGESIGQPIFSKQIILDRKGQPGAWAIPKMVATPRGNALIVLQDRSGGDWGKPIFPVMIRSEDEGGTWSEPTRLIPDNFPRLEDCIFKPTGIVVDHVSSKIFIFISRAPLRKPDGRLLLERDFYVNLQETRNQGRAWFLIESSDDGVTWSEPRVITQQLIKKPHWQEWSPVHSGIQLTQGPYKGRLIIPVRCHCPPSDPSPSFNSRWQTNGVVFSDDHGITWTPGGTTGEHFGEASLVELSDGNIYLHQRASFSQKPQRWFATSKDGGVTFSASKLTGQRDAPCHAGIIRLKDGRLLLSHVPGPQRNNLTLSIGSKKGDVWKVLAIMDTSPTAYSDICNLPGDTFLVTYETGEKTSRQSLAVARFNMEWLESLTGF